MVNFPGEKISDSEMKNNEDKIINQYPFLNMDMKGLNLSFIENLKSGVYRLYDRPSVSFLQSLPYYKKCSSEVGIICINGNWIVCLAEEGQKEVPWPYDIEKLMNQGRLQFDMHSHPKTAENDFSVQPSFEDTLRLGNTFDKKSYIISSRGILEIQMPYLGISIEEFKQIFDHWTFRRYPDEEEYVDGMKNGNLMMEFAKDVLMAKLFEWSEPFLIEDLLDKPEKSVNNQHRF